MIRTLEKTFSVAGIMMLVSAFCACATLFNGIITDSESGEPLEGVKGIFTFNFIAQPPVYSDSAGVLSATVPFNGSTYIGVELSKAGYVAKKIDFGKNQQVTGTYTMSVKMVKLIETPVRFHGTITDSVTRDPLAGVEIQISYSYSETPVVQRITTDSSGHFDQTVILTNEYSHKAYFAITAPGYTKYSGTIIRAADPIARTIRLKPDYQVPIRISGRLVDSATRQPVDSAEACVRVKWAIGEASAFFYTGAGGAFSVTFSAPSDTATILAVSYAIAARGYRAKADTLRMLPSKDTGFGDILLVKSNAAIVPRKPVRAEASAGTVFTAFSLSGRVLSRMRDGGMAKSGRLGRAPLIIVDNAKRPAIQLPKY